MAAVSAFERITERFWVLQNIAQIAPDQIIELIGRDQTPWAFLLSSRPDGGAFVLADVVGIGPSRPAGGSQLTMAATDQGAQQVICRMIVAASATLIEREFPLHLFELLLSDQRWNLRHQEPVVRRLRDITMLGLPDRP
jgi:hypothetical protein